MNINELVFRPSSADRWMACAGSTQLIASLGLESAESKAAAEGKKAHEVAEALLKREKLDYGEVPAEMLSAAAKYSAFVCSFKKPESQLLIEDEVCFNFLGMNHKGRVDAAIGEHGGELGHVFDLKYGQGLKVNAEGNKQLMLYALGLLAQGSDFFSPKSVALHIFQPRFGAGEPSTHTVTLEQLEAFQVEVLAAIAAARAPAPSYTPSDMACKYCPAVSVCPARHEELAAVGAVAAAHEMGIKLPIEELGALIDTFESVKKLIDALEADYRTRLLAGEVSTRHKLVASKPRGAWAKDALEGMATGLAPELFRALVKLEPKLISLTEARAFMGKEQGKLTPYLAKKEPVPVVAGVSDPRLAWDAVAAVNFGNFV